MTWTKTKLAGLVMVGILILTPGMTSGVGLGTRPALAQSGPYPWHWEWETPSSGTCYVGCYCWIGPDVICCRVDRRVPTPVPV